MEIERKGWWELEICMVMTWLMTVESRLMEAAINQGEERSTSAADNEWLASTLCDGSERRF